MSRLIESIKLEDGKFFNLQYHQQRIDRSIVSLTRKKNTIDLHSVLQDCKFSTLGKFKCRIMYTEKEIVDITINPYEAKNITSLKIVYDNAIEYAYKFEDRSVLNNLFSQRNDCDDILIIKNGLVTDSSYSNVVFFDGARWITSAKPLLAGTMRQYLLDTGAIFEDEIRVEQISLFKKVRLINALLGFDVPELSVSQIVF